MNNLMAIDGPVQRLYDRSAIIDVAIRYAAGIDRADWVSFGTLFTDPVHIDFSSAGMPAADFARDDFVGFARQGLEQWDARQHLSTNHEVEIHDDDDDEDRATLRSYMFAQHHAQDRPTFVMHGTYEHDMVRTTEGWQITRLVQRTSWMDNPPADMGGV